MAAGADLRPQIPGRPTGLLSGHFTTHSILDVIPAYQELKRRGLTLAALRDPAVRHEIVCWVPDEMMARRLDGAYAKTHVLGDPPDYEPGPDRSLKGMAAAQGRSPIEVAYDAMLEDDGRALLYVPILGYADGDLEPIREMLMHPRSALGLADGGAHCGAICDAPMPTFMLTHWAARPDPGPAVVPLEPGRAQARPTTPPGCTASATAARSSSGMVGDLNVIDYEGLRVLPPRVVRDLPAGGSRLVQGASGYVATVKSGTVTFEDGEDTGARPGRLLRGGS